MRLRESRAGSQRESGRRRDSHTLLYADKFAPPSVHTSRVSKGEEEVEDSVDDKDAAAGEDDDVDLMTALGRRCPTAMFCFCFALHG